MTSLRKVMYYIANITSMEISSLSHFLSLVQIDTFSVCAHISGNELNSHQTEYISGMTSYVIKRRSLDVTYTYTGVHRRKNARNLRKNLI